MAEKFVKLGVVGLGRGRDVTTDVLGREGVKLTAICDHNPEKLKSAIEHYAEKGVTDLLAFENYDDMLKTDIDAVFIATDAIYHVPFVIKALDAGKHVLSEIPTVNSLEEARALKAAVTAHPELKYMAGENCCYWAFIQEFKRLYDEGRLGDIVYAESAYLHADDYRNFKPEDFNPDHWRSFMPAIHYITHNIGPLLYILDDELVNVTCMESDIHYNPYVNKIDTGVALFKTKKGTIIRILICFGAYVGFDHTFSMIGTRGTIETGNAKWCKDMTCYARFSDVEDAMNKKIEIPVGLGTAEEKGSGHGGADAKMVMAFIDCILNDKKPPIDVDMGIRMSIAGLCAHESAEKGGIPVEIPVI